MSLVNGAAAYVTCERKPVAYPIIRRMPLVTITVTEGLALDC